VLPILAGRVPQPYFRVLALLPVCVRHSTLGAQNAGFLVHADYGAYVLVFHSSRLVDGRRPRLRYSCLTRILGPQPPSAALKNPCRTGSSRLCSDFVGSPRLSASAVKLLLFRSRHSRRTPFPLPYSTPFHPTHTPCHPTLTPGLRWRLPHFTPRACSRSS
jgi:hypothetical protein